jgi:hypothetical protein
LREGKADYSSCRNQIIGIAKANSGYDGYEPMLAQKAVNRLPCGVPRPGMRFLCLTIAFLVLAAPIPELHAQGPDYVKNIKPLLRERCYSCHGGLKQKKGLRLDTAAAIFKGSSDGPVLERGNPSQSRIIQRVTATDPEQRMPPEHEGEPLTAAQIKLLTDWVAAGAPAPPEEKGEADPKEHWAFRACVRPAVPHSGNVAWPKNPIDAFILKGHAQHGLTAQSEAPPEVLLRRLYLDLIGVPPTAKEIARVQNERSDDWYERTAERLLDDPRYGERWARHWMDIWRYSDWYGLGEELRSSQKHIWHWRDWIIQSLNADTPYDEMVKLMLAADELYPDDLDKLRATGFLARNYFLFNRNQWLEETVEHVSKGFLGLTINCAKCHDHKYDPIRQSEFYQMRAFFEPYHVRLDMVPGEPDLSRDGIPRVFDGLLDAPTYRFIRGQENQPDKSATMLPKPIELLAGKGLEIRPVSLPAAAYQPERRSWVLKSHLANASNRLQSAEAAVPKARKALTAALRQEADLLDVMGTDKAGSAGATLSQAEAKNAVELGHAALDVAEATLAFAKADLLSIECRAQAMEASWAATERNASDQALGEGSRKSTVAAVKAERDALLAKGRLTLAEAQQRLTKAAEDKKDAIAKEVRDARAAVEKANQIAQAPVKNTDTYTLLAGAKWTATRFLNSTVDDPPVTFPRLSTGRRTALAKWITDRQNPLTARVAVNHIWTRHFGTPLVPTVFDFGRKGTPPANPELLDWLASEFMDSGWSMKHLHRLIVASATYRMSSSLAGNEANAGRDPDNTYLWRRNPIRLEAEVVRDSLLSLAGVLDPTMWGPPVPPAQQNDSRRRSLYFFHSNNERNLFLTTFDAAGVRECYRRDQSIVPQQALALTNSKLALDSAGLIARRLSEETGTDDQAFVRRAMMEMLGIEVSAAEISTCLRALQKWRQQEPDGKLEAARKHLVWALVNHNDFVTLR